MLLVLFEKQEVMRFLSSKFLKTNTVHYVYRKRMAYYCVCLKVSYSLLLIFLDNSNPLSFNRIFRKGKKNYSHHLVTFFFCVGLPKPNNLSFGRTNDAFDILPKLYSFDKLCDAFYKPLKYLTK